MGPFQMLLFRDRVDLWAMAMKGYYTWSHAIRWFNIISR